LKATKALLKHIKNSEKDSADKAGKRSLLAADDEEDNDELDQIPIWLNVTTKKHIVDTKRLKPGKVALPHALNSSPTTTICLITADPQRAYKDIVASPAFPAELRSRITRVIGLKKIKAKYHQYEAQRQLFAEHDFFLADDRIITQLPKNLGKTFYKTTTKRPIPVSMQGALPRAEGKRIPKTKREDADKAQIEPAKLAKEIEKAISGALVALSPSTQTSVRVAAAGWKAQDVADNIEAVVKEVIEKFVPQKWRGVRALHIKGPSTAAMPIWLADELWADEADVLEDAKPETEEPAEANIGKKRKRVAGEEAEEPKADKKPKREKKVLPESNDSVLDKEIALRKEKLKKQKTEAAKSVVDELPVPAAKAEKSKSKKRKASD
jgi:ribosome biogenesis protein UTP30